MLELGTIHLPIRVWRTSSLLLLFACMHSPASGFESHSSHGLRRDSRSPSEVAKDNVDCSLCTGEGALHSGRPAGASGATCFASMVHDSCNVSDGARVTVSNMACSDILEILPLALLEHVWEQTPMRVCRVTIVSALAWIH
jgi:hypothetical protein